MSIVTIAIIGGAGAIAYGAWRHMRRDSPAAFAEGQGEPGNDTQIRDSGPAAMRDPDSEPWTEVDEDSDESFPASDAPGNY